MKQESALAEIKSRVLRIMGEARRDGEYIYIDRNDDCNFLGCLAEATGMLAWAYYNSKTDKRQHALSDEQRQSGDWVFVLTKEPSAFLWL